MKILTQETYQLIKFNWKNIFIFEFLYRFLTWPLFLKMSGAAMRLALKMAGYSYLTMGNLGAFLLKPWSALCLVFIGMIGVLFLMVEIGGLISGFSASVYYQQLNPVEMLWGGISKLTDEINRRSLPLFGVVLVSYLGIHCFVGFFALTQVRPINILVDQLLEQDGLKLLVALLVVSCLGLMLATLFTFHGCMIEQKNFGDSVVRSKVLLKGKYVQSAVLLTGGNAALFLVFLVLYLLCLVLATVWVILFVSPQLELAFLIGFHERIKGWFIFLASTGGTLFYFAAITVQYYQYQSGINCKERKDLLYAQSKVGARNNLVRVILVTAALSGFCLFDTIYNGNHLGSLVSMQVGITAHRGSSNSAPENTIPAIQAAIDELADFAEIDVQETQDGEIVLFHDSTLRRIAGDGRNIASMTWDEVNAIDAGSWFSEEFQGVGIPRLEEVMELCKGRLNLNIELKNLGANSLLPEKVLELVGRYEMENQCVITSTNIQYLRRIKELQPTVKTGYILSAALGNYYSDEAIDFISIRSGFVNERLVRSSHEAGKAVHVWTVNAKSEMERLRLLGIDNVITDYPLLAKEVLYEEKTAQSLLTYLRFLLKQQL